MPRNSSGTMSNPGSPVVAGTTISVSWANTLVADLIAELTSSLDRGGRGGMTAPLRVPDGSAAAPTISFTGEPSDGMYRAGSGDLRFAVGGVDALKLVSGGVNGPLTLATGTTSVQVTVSGGFLLLQGNRVAADITLADVVADSSVTRTAGNLFGVRNNGTAKLLVDYQGLLSLASQAAPIQPAGIATAVTPGTNIAATGASYFKDACGIVHVQGFVSGSGAAIVNGSVLFNLPAGFRPSDPRQFAAIDSSRNLFGVQVAVNGDVTLIAPVVVNGSGTTSIANSGPVLYLDVIQFLARV